MEEDTLQGHRLPFSDRKKPLEEAIKECAYNNPQLLQEYDRTYIVVDSPNFTFIPEELEKEKKNRRPYYDFCFPGHHDVVVENRLPRNHAYLLFGLAPNLHALLDRTFSGATLLHPLSTLAEFLYTHSLDREEAKAYLNLREKRIDILLFKQGRLLFGNSFDATTPEEISDYALSVGKQAGLDRQEDLLYLVGEIRKSAAIREKLHPYIRTVLPLPCIPQILRLGRETLTAPFELIVLPLCGL